MTHIGHKTCNLWLVWPWYSWYCRYDNRLMILGITVWPHHACVMPLGDRIRDLTCDPTMPVIMTHVGDMTCNLTCLCDPPFCRYDTCRWYDLWYRAIVWPHPWWCWYDTCLWFTTWLISGTHCVTIIPRRYELQVTGDDPAWSSCCHGQHCLLTRSGSLNIHPFCSTNEQCLTCDPIGIKEVH